MQLKPEALNALKLPVKVKAGFLGSVKLKVCCVFFFCLLYLKLKYVCLSAFIFFPFFYTFAHELYFNCCCSLCK